MSLAYAWCGCGGRAPLAVTLWGDGWCRRLSRCGWAPVAAGGALVRALGGGWASRGHVSLGGLWCGILWPGAHWGPRHGGLPVGCCPVRVAGGPLLAVGGGLRRFSRPRLFWGAGRDLDPTATRPHLAPPDLAVVRGPPSGGGSGPGGFGSWVAWGPRPAAGGVGVAWCWGRGRLGAGWTGGRGGRVLFAGGLPLWALGAVFGVGGEAGLCPLGSWGCPWAW